MSELKTIPKSESLHQPYSKNLAEHEADAFAKGDLEKHARHCEHRRTQRFKNSLNYVAVIAIWILSIAILAAIISWFWHFLTPPSCHYLGDDQLRRIETVVFSGLLVGVVQQYLRKHL